MKSTTFSLTTTCWLLKHDLILVKIHSPLLCLQKFMQALKPKLSGDCLISYIYSKDTIKLHLALEIKRIVNP